MRRRRYQMRGIGVVFLVLLYFTVTSSQAQSQELVLLPFQSSANLPDHLGAGISTSLSERLRTRGIIIAPDRRTQPIIKATGMDKVELQKPEIATDAAKALGAKYLVHGKAELEKEGLKLHVTLVDADKQRPFTMTVAREDRNKAEEEVACAIAKVVGGNEIKQPKPGFDEIPCNLYEIYDRAMYAFYEDDFKTAIHYLKQLIPRVPRHLELHRKFEEAARYGNFAREMNEFYEKMVRGHPSSAIYYNYLGNSYLLMDHKDEKGFAYEHYEKAIRLDPGFPPPYNNLGVRAFQRDDLRPAEDFVKKYIGLARNDAMGYMNMGAIYTCWLKKGGVKNPQAMQKKAQEMFQKALKFAPDNVKILARKAYYLEVIGRETEALKLYLVCQSLGTREEFVEQAIKRLYQKFWDETKPPHGLMITRSLRTGKLKPEYRTAITGAGGNADVLEVLTPALLYNQAIKLAEQKKFDEAVTVCRWALKSQPNNYFGKIVVGKINEQRGKEKKN